ncbi:MAG: RNA-binding S4 domain-containing protein [Tissierellia bacterium]|jgi:ribosomal 50S subunit-recycling heat shock protein|nr:RNA-binding S4 domain-containing protein [Tissierellia bacterium]
MRLDKFLKISRLIKRRTVAKEASESGKVLINGKVAKASENVNVGDTITINFSNNTISVEVINDGESITNPKPEELYVRI